MELAHISVLYLVLFLLLAQIPGRQMARLSLAPYAHAYPYSMAVDDGPQVVKTVEGVYYFCFLSGCKTVVALLSLVRSYYIVDMVLVVLFDDTNHYQTEMKGIVLRVHSS